MYRTIILSALAAILVAACSDSPSSGGGSFTAMEHRTHELVNQYRASKGLPTLNYNETVASQARDHSREMSGGNLNHSGFQERVDAIGKSITLSAAAENVALNQGFSDPEQTAVTGWINSPDHRVNMEGDFDLTGIGIDRKSDGAFYFTQIFVKSR